jgi:ATP-dependent Lon protease
MAPTKNVIISKSKVADPDIFVSSALKKTTYLKSVIQRTIVAAQKYKQYDVFGANELNLCMSNLRTAFARLDDVERLLAAAPSTPQEDIIKELQNVSTDLSTAIKSFGTDRISDLISICFGSDVLSEVQTDPKLEDKFSLMEQFVHPIGYKVIPWKSDPKGKASERGAHIKKNRIVEDFTIVESAENFDCFDLARTSRAFLTKVYGVKFAILNPAQRKTMIVCGLVDDVMTECVTSKFVANKLEEVVDTAPDEEDFKGDSFRRFAGCLTIKELLVYNIAELHDRFVGHMNQVILIKQKSIAQVTKEFVSSELYTQRTMIIQLLLRSKDYEYQYLAYLLYDLLTNDNNGSVDTHEQTLLFDSLPFSVKKYFRDAMKQTISYTNNLSNFDSTKIPLEQQICLMKADEVVKEKAMQKLKEVKAKSEDSGSKARQYLEGLLRIPFKVFREEPILRIIGNSTESFNSMVGKLSTSSVPITQFPVKPAYTSVEMLKYAPVLRDQYMGKARGQLRGGAKEILTAGRRSDLVETVCVVNQFLKENGIHYPKLCHSGKKNSHMRVAIQGAVDCLGDRMDLVTKLVDKAKGQTIDDHLPALATTLDTVANASSTVSTFMDSVASTLNDAVHGHDKAKRQVERIIAQWVNGEKSGYCFGFEGPPGVGKTSLAKKGIANCLVDGEGKSRPFAFIAMGGKENGSILDGHSYTYVGSNWGRIVDILMETKCMNPIIFIDELDKVSRTEHGKEIIGILTHLIDTTQNDTFQDKYFSGIDLDLSRALFIFSYNDVDAIDRILLDRIHRVRFKHLSLEDKLTVSRVHLLPEICQKMGLDGVIEVPDEVVEFIIEEYTNEPGVRKLKELLFEIIGEINLTVLKEGKDYEIPIVITKDAIKEQYLKARHPAQPHEVHKVPKIGVMNGLWANSLGKGGVLPIEVSYYPTGTFLELKLTGMQGDVMKESMAVAKTLAWSLASEINGAKRTEEKTEKMKSIMMQGVHIHCPEGATPKDGPSAGTAITVALISLFTRRPIRNDVAITGEMCLQGNVTAIGGLDLKILGGIRGGVKRFLFPKENEKAFNDFMEEFGDKDVVKGIEFHMVETIQDVLPLVFSDSVNV